MALVGRVEHSVEAPIEKEWDGEVPEAMVPLIGCCDASGLRDAGAGIPLTWMASSKTPPAVCDATRTSPGYSATNAVVTKAPML